MKRFRFSLERVLRHRGVQEDLAEQALAQALAQERMVEAELARVSQQMTEEAVALRNDLADCLGGADVALHVRFATALHGRAMDLRVRRAAAAARLQECRQILRERRRAREAVAQLKHAAWRQHCEAALREVQIAIDEVAGGRHERRRAEAEA